MKIFYISLVLILFGSMSATAFAQVKVTGSHTATGYFDAYVPVKPQDAEETSHKCTSNTTVATNYLTAYIPQKLSDCPVAHKCTGNVTVASDYSGAYSRQELSDCS